MSVAGIGDIAEKLRRSTVQIVGGSSRAHGCGSGVICGADGTILTNSHVVVKKATTHVQLWDGHCLPATVEAQDAGSDLAKLKIEAQGLVPVSWRSSALVRPGELVIAVGNPLGFIGALSTGVLHNAGVISGLGSVRWVQAAIRLAPGNSGGPLADAGGRVIGINTMVASTGLGLAIPSETALDFIRRGARPSVGLTVQPIHLNSAGAIGLLVLDVRANSPAERASLLIGDVLTGVDGRTLRSADDLSDAIDRAEGVLTVGFLRGDRRAEREVTIQLPAPRREAA